MGKTDHRPLARRRRPRHATVVAYLALFVALGGTALAADVVVRSNSQVASNTISGHAGSAAHKNIIRESIARGDLAPSVKSSFRIQCPGDLRQAGDVCFEPNARPLASWDTAITTCALAGLRLPDAGELGLVLDHLGAPQGGEWVASTFFVDKEIEAPLLGQSPSRSLTVDFENITTPRSYRCVTGPTN